MRGYVEESSEVETLRALTRAAQNYAGGLLVTRPLGDGALDKLKAAAVAYASAVRPPRSKRNATR